MIQAVRPVDSYAQLSMKRSRSPKIHPLLDPQIKLVPRQIKEWVPEFIQLWEEFHHDVHLLQSVSRVSEKQPDCIERVIYTQTPTVTLTNITTRKQQRMSFQSYLDLPPAEIQR